MPEPNPIIEGLAYLYNFDFPKFRHRAEETAHLATLFHVQGICWKFRFNGGIKLWVNGELILDLLTKEHADALILAVSFSIKPQDDVTVQVCDYQPRPLRWFRPNNAVVTLEGIEQPPAYR